MRLVLIIGVALLILGGGGAGAYFYFMHPAEASVGDTAEHKDASEAGKEHGKEGEAAVFVEMDPLILPIVGARGATQTISLVIVLEVASEKDKETVKNLIPRLKDAYIQNMYGVLSRRNAMPDGMLQIAPLKERLNRISKQVLGEGVVNDVLLQVVQQRPI